ncbi:MAG: hypothetical protein EBQ92_03010 [Proteobacteria bacterium]|nr:hypothetical protein [Pseudomonadota bacterium]
MLKASSLQNSHSQIVLQELRDLIPLVAVAFSLFIFAVLTMATQGPKSKPVVRNEKPILTVFQP